MDEFSALFMSLFLLWFLLFGTVTMLLSAFSDLKKKNHPHSRSKKKNIHHDGVAPHESIHI